MHADSCILQDLSILAPLTSLLRKKAYLLVRIAATCQIPNTLDYNRAFSCELSLRSELLDELAQQLHQIHLKILQHNSSTHKSLNLSSEFRQIITTKAVINALLNNHIILQNVIPLQENIPEIWNEQESALNSFNTKASAINSEPSHNSTHHLNPSTSHKDLIQSQSSPNWFLNELFEQHGSDIHQFKHKSLEVCSEYSESHISEVPQTCKHNSSRNRSEYSDPRNSETTHLFLSSPNWSHNELSEQHGLEILPPIKHNFSEVCSEYFESHISEVPQIFKHNLSRNRSEYSDPRYSETTHLFPSNELSEQHGSEILGLINHNSSWHLKGQLQQEKVLNSRLSSKDLDITSNGELAELCDKQPVMTKLNQLSTQSTSGEVNHLFLTTDFLSFAKLTSFPKHYPIASNLTPTPIHPVPQLRTEKSKLSPTFFSRCWKHQFQPIKSNNSINLSSLRKVISLKTHRWSHKPSSLGHSATPDKKSSYNILQSSYYHRLRFSTMVTINKEFHPTSLKLIFTSSQLIELQHSTLLDMQLIHAYEPLKSMHKLNRFHSFHFRLALLPRDAQIPSYPKSEVDLLNTTTEHHIPLLWHGLEQQMTQVLPTISISNHSKTSAMKISNFQQPPFWKNSPLFASWSKRKSNSCLHAHSDQLMSFLGNGEKITDLFNPIIVVKNRHQTFLWPESITKNILNPPKFNYKTASPANKRRKKLPVNFSLAPATIAFNPTNYLLQSQPNAAQKLKTFLASSHKSLGSTSKSIGKHQPQFRQAQSQSSCQNCTLIILLNSKVQSQFSFPDQLSRLRVKVKLPSKSTFLDSLVRRSSNLNPMKRKSSLTANIQSLKIHPSQLITCSSTNSRVVNLSSPCESENLLYKPEILISPVHFRNHPFHPLRRKWSPRFQLSLLSLAIIKAKLICRLHKEIVILEIPKESQAILDIQKHHLLSSTRYHKFSQVIINRLQFEFFFIILIVHATVNTPVSFIVCQHL